MSLAELEKGYEKIFVIVLIIKKQFERSWKRD
jgi:hypothetical protein